MGWWGKPPSKEVIEYEDWSIFELPSHVLITRWCGWPKDASWEKTLEKGGPVVCGDLVDKRFQIKSFYFDMAKDIQVHGWLTDRGMTSAEAKSEIAKIQQLFNIILS